MCRTTSQVCFLARASRAACRARVVPRDGVRDHGVHGLRAAPVQAGGDVLVDPPGGLVGEGRRGGRAALRGSGRRDPSPPALFRSWDCQAGTTDTRPASVAGLNVRMVTNGTKCSVERAVRDQTSTFQGPRVGGGRSGLPPPPEAAPLARLERHGETRRATARGPISVEADQRGGSRLVVSWWSSRVETSLLDHRNRLDDRRPLQPQRVAEVCVMASRRPAAEMRAASTPPSCSETGMTTSR